jgi:hypothetical protein
VRRWDVTYAIETYDSYTETWQEEETCETREQAEEAAADWRKSIAAPGWVRIVEDDPKHGPAFGRPS